MKKKFLFAFFCLFFFTIWAIPPKKRNAIAGWRLSDYSAECLGVGSEGTQLLKVFFYFKKEKEAGVFAKKNAVDAVLFRGIAAGELGCLRTPLIDAAGLEKHADYFEKFFEDGGTYLTFIAASSDQLTNRVKVGKQYRAAMSISVNLVQLRKKLENDNIIKPFGAVFQ